MHLIKKCSLRVDTMTLKKTTKKEISKAKTKLPQILILKSQLFSSKLDSKKEFCEAEKGRSAYHQLQFSKKGSSNHSRLYTQKWKDGKEITVIPDTDTKLFQALKIIFQSVLNPLSPKHAYVRRK